MTTTQYPLAPEVTEPRGHVVVTRRKSNSELIRAGVLPPREKPTREPVQVKPALEHHVHDPQDGFATAALKGLEVGAAVVQFVSSLVAEHGSQMNAEGLLELMAAARAMSASLDAVVMKSATHFAADKRFLFEDEHGYLISAPEEIGMALGISASTAGRWIRAGRQVFGRLYEVGELFEDGQITAHKACSVAESLATVEDDLALTVQDELAPVLVQANTREVKERIAEVLNEIDPSRVDERHDEACKARHVSRVSRLADGMAAFRVVMPADHAVSVNTALDTAANYAKSDGDARTRQQLRADTLAGWAISALADGGSVPNGIGTESRDGAGLRDGAAARDGAGPASLRVPPARINVTIPLEVLAYSIDGWEGVASTAQRVMDETMGVDPEQSALPESSGDASTTVRDGMTESAWLEGYGSIPPAMARMLAAGGTWRRIITDGASGLPLDIGRKRYTPPAQIKAAVMLRDKTCSRPGCGRPASYCDLDHVHEWANGSTTSMNNLTLLCRRCHRLKSLGAGRIQIDSPAQSPPEPPGTGASIRSPITWRSTLGTSYQKPPTHARKYTHAHRSHGSSPPF